ncbi:MAG: hypothetical protein K2N43_04855 [Lachnospiraceae bacterium]|nr:hypothetical protein [Lachnospiraceae bacterium]
MYQKEIIYLGLYKDGNRLGNAGFLRVEKRGKEGNLFLTVKNAPRSINGRFPVRYYSGTDWKEADGVAVRDGGGQWEKREVDSLEQVRLQIVLPGGYLIEGTSKTVEGIPVQETKAEQVMEVESVPEQKPEEKEEPKRQPRQVEYIAVERPHPQETVAAQKTPAVQETVKAQPSMSLPPVEGLKEDKWEQILDTYDHIHPYGDERVFVKLEPKDFLILHSKYQPLVNNSFLLHGFYNYRHVILGKEGEVYYLGVPGVFYEREKMVALMFGFEAFDCASGEPKAGEFGYYLRKVEL